MAYVDKAKAAVLEFVDALPDGIEVGLRVYGHREPNDDPVQGCRDTELVVPVAPLDRASFRDALAGVAASGFTPIGLSLWEAVDDLPEFGARSIILMLASAAIAGGLRGGVPRILNQRVTVAPSERTSGSRR